MQTLIIDIPNVSIDNPALPVVEYYSDIFGTMAGLIAHWDFTDPSAITLASTKIASISASVGAGALAQPTDSLRPVASDAGAVFSAGVLQYDGTHPAGEHAVVVIARGVGTGSNQVLAGSGRVNVADDTRHMLAASSEAGGLITYSAGPRYANAVLPGAGHNILAIGGYDADTKHTSVEVNGAAQQFVGGAIGTAPSAAFFVGAGSAVAGQPLSGVIQDVFLFSRNILSRGEAGLIRQYAREIRGISL